MHPGFIWFQKGALAYNRRETGEGVTFYEHKKTRVSCEDYGGAMVASPLLHHMDRTHGIVLPQTRGVDVGIGGPKTYVVLFPWVLNLVECPVDG